MDVEAALYPVPSLCPTQRRCYDLMRYHGAAESQTSEAVSAFFDSYQNLRFDYNCVIILSNSSFRSNSDLRLYLVNCKK